MAYKNHDPTRDAAGRIAATYMAIPLGVRPFPNFWLDKEGKIRKSLLKNGPYSVRTELESMVWALRKDDNMEAAVAHVESQNPPREYEFTGYTPLYDPESDRKYEKEKSYAEKLPELLPVLDIIYALADKQRVILPDELQEMRSQLALAQPLITSLRGYWSNEQMETNDDLRPQALQEKARGMAANDYGHPKKAAEYTLLEYARADALTRSNLDDAQRCGLALDHLLAACMRCVKAIDGKDRGERCRWPAQKGK